ncbi:MAG: hypothetical protein SFU56_11100 [Capsulimonadales bacterium]|nr:hypothetical protein [Capsulimonadales bacterium]
MELLTFGLNAWKSEPAMRIEDAYKWLFHAVRGGEHAVTDPDGPRRWLDREWLTLDGPFPNEPLVVALRPDRAIVRLNLRPYRARGGGRERLLQAFVRSAHGFRGEAATFATVWRELGRTLERGDRGALTAAEWRRCDRETAPDHYPALHHSEHYEKIRKPAYRVLTATEAATLSASLRPSGIGRSGEGKAASGRYTP